MLHKVSEYQKKPPSLHPKAISTIYSIKQMKYLCCHNSSKHYFWFTLLISLYYDHLLIYLSLRNLKPKNKQNRLRSKQSPQKININPFNLSSEMAKPSPVANLQIRPLS